MQYLLNKPDQLQGEPTIVRYLPDRLIADKAVLNEVMFLDGQIGEANDGFNASLGFKMKLGGEASNSKQMFVNYIKRCKVIYIIKDDVCPLGMCTVMPAEFDQSLFISQFGINKKFRRRGLGKMLMNHIVQDLSKYNLLLRVSSVNTAALALYASCGFTTEVSKVLAKKKG